MVLLNIYRRVADSNALTALAVAMEIVSFSVMVAVKGATLEEFGAGSPPDIWFGYSSAELNAFYDAIGQEGCKAYEACAKWDFFPYMWSYAILLGSILVRVSRWAGVAEGIAHIMTAMAICDVAETAVQLHGCRLLPERLKEDIVVVGSLANQAKWVFFAVALAAVAILSFRGGNGAAKTSKDKVR